MRKAWLAVFLGSSILITGCNDEDTENGNTPPVVNNVKALSYELTAVLPHDTSYFTQGLEFYKGFLIEGTGNYGHSRLMKIDLQSGKVLKQVNLESGHFGEGITVLNDTIYQLTWKNGIVHLYSATDLKKIGQQPLKTEGWGITHDSNRLIVSDGSNNLYFYEPGSFRQTGTIQVTENGSPAVNLNELEYIKGYIYANQWQYNYILKIDPSTGQVVGKLDLGELGARAKARNPGEQFLNGIAYNPETDKIYVTGKYWPEMYEISFAH